MAQWWSTFFFSKYTLDLLIYFALASMWIYNQNVEIFTQQKSIGKSNLWNDDHFVSASMWIYKSKNSSIHTRKNKLQIAVCRMMAILSGPQLGKWPGAGVVDLWMTGVTKAWLQGAAIQMTTILSQLQYQCNQDKQDNACYFVSNSIWFLVKSY